MFRQPSLGGVATRLVLLLARLAVPGGGGGTTKCVCAPPAPGGWSNDYGCRQLVESI
jgi:hypothetical protein